MIILGLLLFVCLVVVHEMGHFLVARRNGVEVEEFGLGFPPKLVGKTMGKGIWQAFYTLNLLPLGGFVRLKGENEEDKRAGSYGATSFWVKTKITLAGVAMNYIVAIILLSLVAAIRLPVLFDNQFTIPSDTTELPHKVVVAAVADDSPAAKAGLKRGSVIKTIAGETVTSSEQLAQLTRQHAGGTVELEITRKGDAELKEVSLVDQPSDGKSFLGVGPQDLVERKVTWSAPVVGFVVTNQFGWETLRSVGRALHQLIQGDTTAASEQVSGPVGIFAALRETSSFTQLALITGVISLSLAVVNILPIPALDGGRLALSGLFRLLRRPLSARVENAVHMVGFGLLIGLVILITIVDVRRL